MTLATTQPAAEGTPPVARRARPSMRDRLAQRWAARWPVIRRQLPRDAVIVLWVAVLFQYVAFGPVLTDSVHTSMAVVLKGVPAKPGDLVAFGYQGRPIGGYYAENWLTKLQARLGMQVDLTGPARGDAFIKYLVGVTGDRVEVEGDRVYLQTRNGRFFMGVCKPATRRGVPLQPIAAQTIPDGYVYVWAPHVDALDSRYETMGLVPASALYGKAVRLW